VRPPDGGWNGGPAGGESTTISIVVVTVTVGRVS
jgi:hypothetical protein